MISTRLQRTLRLLEHIQSGRTETVTEIAEELGVSRRTVFRDLQELQLSGIPVAYDRKSLRYELKDDRPRVPLNFTSSDAFLLSFITKLLRDHPLFFDRAGAMQLADKLEPLIPDSMRDYATHLNKYIAILFSEYEGVNDAMTTASSILFAISRSTKVVNGSQLVIHPYRLVYHADTWQVLAFSESHDDVRLFCLDALTPTTILQDRYSYQREFDMSALLG